MGVTWAMVGAEQSECAALFRSIAGEEWDVETLCAGWTVRDMLSHIASAVTTDPAQAIRAIRLRNNVHRLNEAVIEAWRGRDAQRLIGKLEQVKVPSIVQRILGPANSLRALMIHQQDIRRPLGRRRELDPERSREVLSAIVTEAGGNLGSVERSDGLRLVAEDIGWTHGDGPEVSGLAEAVLMAIAGRRDAIDELAGPGIAVLTTRL